MAAVLYSRTILVSRGFTEFRTRSIPRTIQNLRLQARLRRSASDASEVLRSGGTSCAARARAVAWQARCTLRTHGRNRCFDGSRLARGLRSRVIARRRRGGHHAGGLRPTGGDRRRVAGGPARAGRSVRVPLWRPAVLDLLQFTRDDDL